MQVTTVINGVIKIVLTAETELERLLLKEIGATLTVEKATDNLVIMNKPMPDSIVLSTQKPTTNE